MVVSKKYLTPNDIDAYKRSFGLSNYVWGIVLKWDYFPKRTVGIQFVNAVDSSAANIAEGFGRFYKKDKVRFYKIASGSVFEALDWNEKAKTRKLLNPSEYAHILRELKELQREINQLIAYTNKVLKK